MSPQPVPPDEPVITSGTTSAPVNASDSRSGFGPYRFLQRLGEGGMGEVWLAEQLRPVQRQVAIKIVKVGMDTARVVDRFDAERQALAVMNHPAIAKIFDGGTTPEGRPYFAMEYVRGEAITSYCDRQRLPIRERLELFIQLCDGVQHAHQKGIIHRDLKPSNVLVSVSDDHPVPRIIDFGIAKAIAQPLTDRYLCTEFGGLLGTPEYMSPEQAELTPLDVDTRSDLYSLGALLYELLVGTLPFDSEALRRGGLDEIRRTILGKDPLRPSSRITHNGPASIAAAEHRRIQPSRLAAVLRGDLDWITMKALDKDRTRRYQTANALALDVRRHLSHEPVSAGPPSTAYRLRKFVRRHRVGVAAVTTLGVLVLAFTGIVTVQAGRIARERDRANLEAATATQVADFLVGLFKTSDPDETRGSALTAREILANGARQIGDSLGDQPAVRARLQATIGDVYSALGMESEARPLLEQALNTQRGVLGQHHTETLKTAFNLATSLWFLNRFSDAALLYEDVLEARRRAFGENHSATLEAQYGLATAYLGQGRVTEAEQLLKETMAVQRTVLGQAHKDTLATMNNLQALYFRQKRYAEAEPIATAVVDGRRQLLGDDAPQTLTAIHNLATIYDETQRYEQAEALFLQSLDGKRRILGEEHRSTSVTFLRLAKMYQTLHRYSEAEHAALAGLDGLARSLGDDNASTKNAIEQLVALYNEWGQDDKARQWSEKLTK